MGQGRWLLGSERQRLSIATWDFLDKAGMFMFVSTDVLKGGLRKKL